MAPAPSSRSSRSRSSARSRGRPTQPPPVPHTMCHPSESSDRRLHLELSEFESTSSTFALGPRQRAENPRLVVKKYRRSAAGGGVGGGRSSDGAAGCRTVPQLFATVEHLLGYVLPVQRTYDALVMKPRPLCQTVAFVDDRVRAVQVDLTTSLGVEHLDDDDAPAGGAAAAAATRWDLVRDMQARLVRYGILMSYVLSDVPPTKYEAKFGRTALRTAIDSYFAAWDASFSAAPYGGGGGRGRCLDEPTEDELEVRDEMMSYEALMHVASSVRAGETSLPAHLTGGGGAAEDGAAAGGRGCGAVLASYLKRGGGYGAASSADVWVEAEERGDGNGDGPNEVPDLVDESSAPAAKPSASASASSKPSKWSVALEVAAAADSGNLIKVLRLLTPSTTTHALSEEDQRWGVLARCCIVPALNVVRIGMVRRYNKSFGKMEKVTGEDLARLLQLPTPESAVRFCADIGLPTARSAGIPDGRDDDRVVMKAAPISVTDHNAVTRMVSPGRAEDGFVFGREVVASWDVAVGNDRSGGGDGGGLATASGSSSANLSPPVARAAQSSARRWGDDSDSDDDVDDWEKNAGEDDNSGGGLDGNEDTARVDQDGVLVPPPRLIWELVT